MTLILCGRWEGSAPPATDVTWYYISAMDAMHQVPYAPSSIAHVLSKLVCLWVVFATSKTNE